jgi:hypothetical protein
MGIIARANIRVAASVPGSGNVGPETDRLAQFGNRLRELTCRGEFAAALLMRFGAQSRT